MSNAAAISTPLLDVSASTTPDRPAPVIADSHSHSVTNEQFATVDHALRAFFTESPVWLDKLLRLRNVIVSKFGFETGPSGKFELPQRFVVGDNIGTFEVLARSDDEIIMGGNDQRFGMEISIWLPDGENRLQLSTLAHPNDAIGKAYLNVVRIPHGLIAPLLLRKMTQSEMGV